MKARLSVWTLLLSAVPAWGQGGLAEATLEQLLETRVTSVSKKEQELSRTAAAVFVITQEDIQRSGASTLPDLLRMAPGVDVAQINANSWAISIRGFNSRYSNKVLVLVDGRSVYTPTFSGVYWEHLDLPLEDIERIEVIRGPGASVWGANAVNGVINIITKPAAATQGGRVSAMAGSEVYAGDALRYGARAGARGAYRVFANYGHNGGSLLGNGSPAADGWARMHAGFRSDWELSPRGWADGRRGIVHEPAGRDAAQLVLGHAVRPVVGQPRERHRRRSAGTVDAYGARGLGDGTAGLLRYVPAHGVRGAGGCPDFRPRFSGPPSRWEPGTMWFGVPDTGLLRRAQPGR